MRRMISLRRNGYQFIVFIGMFIVLIVVLAACGGAGTSTSTPSSAGAQVPAQSRQPVSSGSSSSSRQGKNVSDSIGQQYLIKSLQVDMAVKDTRQVAFELQTWLSTTDPRSSSMGIDYTQTDDNVYSVSLRFSVQASLYPQIEQYLAGYAPQHGGKLLNLHQDTQDVTNDYIDTQSRLKNLRTAQTRLLTLLSHSNSIGDIITVQQQLSDVEGQIESIEAHLNALQGQVTFYNVAINLQPLSPTAATQSGPWNPGKTFQDALAAGLALGAGLLTFVIWLAIFSVYIIPLALIGWFVWRRTRSRRVVAATAMAAPAQPAP